VDKLKLEFKEDAELSKQEYLKVKAVIREMLTKAIPKNLMIEAVLKRYEYPTEVMLIIMMKYQPGNKKEKGALLQQIQNPQESWTEEEALVTLKMWKRRNERA
jgi:hypothetical protein